MTTNETLDKLNDNTTVEKQPELEVKTELTPEEIKKLKDEQVMKLIQQRKNAIEDHNNTLLSNLTDEDAYIARKYMSRDTTYNLEDLLHKIKIHKKRRRKNRLAKQSRKQNRQFKKAQKEKRNK